MGWLRRTDRYIPWSFTNGAATSIIVEGNEVDVGVGS